MKIIYLDTVPSTNTYLAEHSASLPSDTVVIAHTQAAGRGQRGNTWEAAPGLNVTLSVLLRPRELHISQAFLLSEAVSVAIADALDPFVAPHTIALKWPNDIYVDHCKLGGILIENALTGPLVTRSIAGVGVNVNQLRFISSAPNPVSIARLTGHTLPVDSVARAIAEAIVSAPALLAHPDALQTRYFERLWHRTTPTLYTDVATGLTFTATIRSVAPSGHITLLTPDGPTRPYAFKEISVNTDALSIGNLLKNV